MTKDCGVRAVMLDVGGVLDRPADQEAEDADRRQLAASAGLALDELWRHLYQTEPWMLARVGKITDAEFWMRTLSPLGMTAPAEQQAFVRRLNAFREVTPEMRALLGELQGRVKLAVISNATETLEAILERFQVSDHFSVIVNSARVGLAKPDPAIYRLALDRLQLRPGQSVFVDDQQHNVEAAAELGIHATLFTSVADLRAFLAGLGVLNR